MEKREGGSTVVPGSVEWVERVLFELFGETLFGGGKVGFEGEVGEDGHEKC